MEKNKDIFTYINTQETEEGYSSEILIEAAKIKEIEKNSRVNIKEGQGIKHTLFNNLWRKNIIYLGKMISETPIEISEAKGTLNLPIIERNSINNKLREIPREKRAKISYIHIGRIQIVLKSTYLRGIDSPIELIIMDNRIKNQEESIIGIIQGNLGYTTIKFEVALQYGIPLDTKNLDNSIGIAFNFKRQDLMEQGDYPFSISYAVGYALSNSNHSIEFIDKERISIDEIFEKTSTQKRLLKRKPLERNNQSKRMNLSRSIREIQIEKPLVIGTNKNEENNIEENINLLKNQVSTLQILAEGINKKL